MIQTAVPGYRNNHDLYVQRRLRVTTAIVMMDDTVVVTPVELSSVATSGVGLGSSV